MTLNRLMMPFVMPEFTDIALATCGPAAGGQLS